MNTRVVSRTNSLCLICCDNEHKHIMSFFNEYLNNLIVILFEIFDFFPVSVFLDFGGAIEECN